MLCICYSDRRIFLKKELQALKEFYYDLFFYVIVMMLQLSFYFQGDQKLQREQT